MKYKVIFLLAVYSVTITAASAKKPKKSPDPVLCGIKTIFIDGNNTAAFIMRREWTSWTGIVVANTADADATLEVNQDSTQEATSWPRGSFWTRYVTNVTLKDKNGKQLWADSRSTTESWPVVQKQKDSVEFVMLDFKNEAACIK